MEPDRKRGARDCLGLAPNEWLLEKKVPGAEGAKSETWHVSVGVGPPFYFEERHDLI